MPKADLCGKLRIRAPFFAENEGSFGNPLTNRPLACLAEIQEDWRYPGSTEGIPAKGMPPEGIMKIGGGGAGGLTEEAAELEGCLADPACSALDFAEFSITLQPSN